MSNRSSLVFFVLSALAFVTACTDGDPSTPPDAGSDGSPPTAVHGRFDVQSHVTLTAAPPEVGELVTKLAAATDGPDDPSRYLVDLVIARLPDGDTRRVAEFLAPSLAAYLQTKVATFAPELAPGIRALAAGLGRLSTELGFREHHVIEPDGTVRRTLWALDVDGRVVDIAAVAARAQVSLFETGVGSEARRELVVSEHALRLDYSELVRRGFAHGVIPAVVPEAIDLGGALAALVDCTRLGALLAERVGFGAPGLYAHACTYGLAAAAAELDAAVPAAVTLPLSLRGRARAVDSDRDGRIDTLHAGAWEGDGVRGAFLGVLRAD